MPLPSEWPILLALGLALLGLAVAWIFLLRANRRSTTLAQQSVAQAERLAALGQERDSLMARNEALQRQILEQAQELARLAEANDQQQLQADEKLALLRDAREAMTKEFKLLSAEIAGRQGQELARQQEQRLTGLLTPLKERINAFQGALQLAQQETVKERAGLTQQIKSLFDTNQAMREETRNLTRALKGQSQVQGAWGEMLLASILERSGLREGLEYETQVSQSDGRGGRLRPDVVVTLPNRDRIIIDAKVSLTAFETYVNAEEEAEKVEALAAHLRSLRGHIRGLGDKSYHQGEGGPDFVILFLPLDEALSVVARQGEALQDEALDRDVLLATPTSLMVALKTVQNLWQVERRSQSVEEIAKRGGLLYDKFVGFVEDLQAVGQRLDQAKVSYEDALAKLSQGSGNLVGQADKLRQLGAKTRKALPADLLEAEAPDRLTPVDAQPSYLSAPSRSSED
ncbi:MAG: DNA recombination protein RmuC [Pseudomonadota bacterium]